MVEGSNPKGQRGFRSNRAAGASDWYDRRCRFGVCNSSVNRSREQRNEKTRSEEPDYSDCSEGDDPLYCGRIQRSLARIAHISFR
jgi:hypothetical protein